jgi:hypothetical protein
MAYYFVLGAPVENIPKQDYFWTTKPKVSKSRQKSG